jgi:hypothetical protein
MAAKIYRSVGGYLGGLLGICAINAVLTTIFGDYTDAAARDLPEDAAILAVARDGVTEFAI